jgi:hypothetical protein
MYVKLRNVLRRLWTIESDLRAKGHHLKAEEIRDQLVLLEEIKLELEEANKKQNSNT